MIAYPLPKLGGGVCSAPPPGQIRPPFVHSKLGKLARVRENAILRPALLPCLAYFIYPRKTSISPGVMRVSLGVIAISSGEMRIPCREMFIYFQFISSGIIGISADIISISAYRNAIPDYRKAVPALFCVSLCFTSGSSITQEVQKVCVFRLSFLCPAVLMGGSVLLPIKNN